jgi:DNA-binding response OmpR family regulator
MKVLLIEDSPEIVKSISLTFKVRQPSARMISFIDGKKGIQAVWSEAPDVVILDINLPDISGFEVLKSIRRFSTVPVIILTVCEDEMDKLRGLQIGADDYIIKPFHPTDLLTRIQDVLHRKGALAV